MRSPRSATSCTAGGACPTVGRLPHLVVARLREVLVPEADGVERLRRGETDDLVGLLGEQLARVGGRRGNRDDHLGRPLASYTGGRGPHRRAGRETVVDENHRAAAQVERRPVPAV